MLFKLTNNKTTRITHSGVLEFVADEGKVYLPYWMMHNLLLEEGGLLQIESISLPIATFSKFQPQSEDFLDITNPKAVLENGLRNFACLTTGDIIAITYNDKVYELCVLETMPGRAVSIIECDMNVEFAAPLGYKEPKRVERVPAVEEGSMHEDCEDDPNAAFVAFSGQGNRLDGRKKGNEAAVGKLIRPPVKRGIPDYDYKLGTLRFIRTTRSVNGAENKEEQDPFEAFSGEGNVLRDKTRK